MKSTERITSILIALFEKEKPTVTDLTERYETTERTIQRDLATIREMLIEQRSAVTLHKDHRGRYYIQNPARIPIEEALALSKIVLSSRAFNKTELNQILTHLRSQLTAESQNILDRIIGSENIQYHELQHHLAPHDASILTRLNHSSHTMLRRLRCFILATHGPMKFMRNKTAYPSQFPSTSSISTFGSTRSVRIVRIQFTVSTALTMLNRSSAK